MTELPDTDEPETATKVAANHRQEGLLAYRDHPGAVLLPSDRVLCAYHNLRSGRPPTITVDGAVAQERALDWFAEQNNAATSEAVIALVRDNHAAGLLRVDRIIRAGDDEVRMMVSAGVLGAKPREELVFGSWSLAARGIPKDEWAEAVAKATGAGDVVKLLKDHASDGLRMAGTTIEGDSFRVACFWP